MGTSEKKSKPTKEYQLLENSRAALSLERDGLCIKKKGALYIVFLITVSYLENCPHIYPRRCTIYCKDD